MRSRNPLFRSLARLSACQVVDMALLESELAMRRRNEEPHITVRRIGLAMQNKLHNDQTASDVCQDIIRRALSLSPEERYPSVAELAVDLHRIRAVLETAERARRASRRSLGDRLRRPLKRMLYATIALGIAVGSTLAIHYLYPNGIFLKSVEIPALVGQNIKSITPDEALYVWEMSYRFDRESEVGTILSQSPQAGMTRRVSPGRHPCTVQLTVSLGPRQVQVGDYVGMTQNQAMAECRRLGLLPSIKRVNDHIAGNVAKSDPPAGTVLCEGEEIVLYVGTARRMTTVAVPNLVGNSEIAAATMLSSLGLVCRHVSYMSDDAPSGTVIAQSILSGTEVRSGADISLVVSRGRS